MIKIIQSKEFFFKWNQFIEIIILNQKVTMDHNLEFYLKSKEKSKNEFCFNEHFYL